MSESFSFAACFFLFAVTAVGVTVITSYLATIPLTRSQGGGGGFKLCVLPGAHLTQLSENVTPIVSGAVFIRAIIDIGTSIFGPFLRKDHEPVHFCHANYILISDRGTSPKVF